MKLFKKRASQPAVPKVAAAPASVAPAATPPPPKPRQIALSTEQKDLLQTPVDPRVDRILQEIYSDRAAAERALKSRRIIEFPRGDSGERRVVQDEDGFWRIVPVSIEWKAAQLGDRL